MKLHELRKRKQNREKADEERKKAEEDGNIEEAQKHAKRNIDVTKKITEDTKKLLTLMGIPYIDAPCEAEATCVEMLKKNIVYGVASEDTDCLTFGCTNLVRQLCLNRKDKNGKVINPTS